MNKSDKNFEDMINQIYVHMLHTRGDKYKWFVRALKAFKYIAPNPGKLERGKLLESYYTLMRYVDDVVDGDAPLPEGGTNAVDYVKEKIDFANNPNEPKDSADALMLYCFELADNINIDISLETQDILSSLLFDAQRRGKSTIYLEEELQYYFHLLDIKGTVKGGLKVFGENPDKYHVLEPLGMASRVYYNLRDFKEDINTGLVNISFEDFEKYEIDPNNLKNRNSSGVQEWFVDQAKLGMELLEQYKRNLFKEQFRKLSLITGHLVYEKPAKKYFEKILA